MMMFVYLLVHFIVLSCIFKKSDSSLAMSVDLGSEFMKIAIVVPRRPMEVALDGESKRKTPTAIGFRNDERVFGRAATNLALQRPELVFQTIIPLIGKTLDYPTVKLFRERYPYHKIRMEESSRQLIFDHPNGMSFTVEELVAMLLEHAREIAESNVAEGTVLQSAVLTVPYFFGQTERRSLLRAAELAGLDVLQLINTNAAVALDYGIYRHNTITATVRNVMFFDLGYTSTTATVVSYKLGKHYQDGVASEAPLASVIGVGSLSNLGTSTFIFRLRDHLAHQFKLAKPKIKTDVTTNNRAMAKLLQEASRVFVMLSANTEVTAQIEGLIEDEDFRFKLTRNDLKSIGADAFDQLRQPFLTALNTSQLQLSDIDEIVLMGGGSRVPNVQEILLEIGLRPSLGKGINSDESAVMGAVYQAAASIPGFKVKRLVMRDYNPYPIAVDFERASNKNEKDEQPDSNNEVNENNQNTNNTSFIRRVLFPRGNPYPQKRAITFNRHTDDFSFFMNYAELSDQDIAYLQTANLSSAVTKGVSSVIKRHEKAELRGVKAHFTLDPSGILILTSVDCLLEPIPEPASEEGVKSTFEKLGSTITGLFSGSGSSDSVDVNGTAPDLNTNTTTVNLTESDQSKQNVSDVNATQSGNTGEIKVTPPKKSSSYSERIRFHLVYMDAELQTDDDKVASKQKLAVLAQADRDKRDWEHAMNELESNLFSTRELIESNDYKAHAKPDDLATIDKLVSEYVAWYDDQGPATPKEEFDERLSELRKLLIPIELRVKQTKYRPVAFEKLDKMLKNATEFFTLMQQAMASINLAQSNETATSTEQPAMESTTNDNKPNFVTPPILPPLFTDSEQQTLESIISKTKTWFEDAKQKVSAMSPVEQPPILVTDIEEKEKQLQREVVYLQKKLLKWQTDMERLLQLRATTPKPTTTAEKPTMEKEATSKTTEPAEETSSASQPDPSSQEHTDYKRDEL